MRSHQAGWQRTFSSLFQPAPCHLPARKKTRKTTSQVVLGGAATDALSLGRTFLFIWLKPKITDLCVDLTRFFQIKRLRIQEKKNQKTSAVN